MQMSPNALEIEAGGNGHMMQMRFRQPLIRTAPQSRGTHRLRDRPFNSSPPGVLLQKGRSGLLGSSLQQSCVHLWRGEGERAAALAMGTLGSYRTLAAGRRGKAHHYRLMRRPIGRLG